MKKKDELKIEILSNIKDELVDKQSAKRYKLMNRKRLPKWIIPSSAAAVVVLAMMIPLFMLLFVKQVPIYTGMSVSDKNPTSMAAEYKPKYSLGLLANMDNNGNHNGQDNGNGNKKPVKDIVEDTLSVTGTGEEIYYAKPQQDIYITLHIDNPDNFVILSFTLNGKVYSSYMFEEGSDMENIVLKYNVGDAQGIVEYTVDAIKYVDGNEIKDVIMEGDRTVKVGVYSEGIQPTASITNELVGINEISFTANLSDKYALIERSGGKTYAILCGEDNIIAYKELSVGDNEIVFDGLETYTSYRYGIVAYYDSLDGSGMTAHVMLENEFTTQSLVAIGDVEVDQTSIDFNVIFNEAFESKALSSMALYLGEEKVRDFDVSGDITPKTFSATELLSNNTYRLVLTYESLGETETVEFELTTEAKATPNITITENSKTQTSIKFDVEVTDVDSVGAITKLELIHGEDVQNVTDLDTREFTELLSNNTYTVKVIYTYDLNDGVGEHIIEKTVDITTEAKATPDITITENSKTQTSIKFDVEVTDTDSVGAMTKLELIHGEDAQNITDLDTREFTDLLSNNTYTVKVTYTYDLNDGTGAHEMVTTLDITTETKATPDITITENSKTQTSIKFDVEVTDVDSVGAITKLELIHGEDAQNITDLDTREFTDLLSNNTYTVKMTYTYDLNDGVGEQTIEKTINIATEEKAEPTFNIKDVTSEMYTVNGSYDQTNVDNTLISHTVKLYNKDDEIVKENADKEIAFDSLDYYTDYTVKITYTFDVNDGKGVQEKVVEQTVKTIPYIDVTSVSVLDKKDVYLDGDKATVRINVDNPLMVTVVSVTIDGVAYKANASSTTRIVLVDIADMGKLGNGKIEGFTVNIDGVEYNVTDISEAKLDVLVLGTLDITSWEIVNKNFERIEYAALGDKVYVVISADKLAGNTVTSLKLTHGESSSVEWADTDPSPAFTIEYGADEIKMLDDGRFYVELKADGAKGYHFNTVSATYKNDYIESTESINNTFYQHPFVMLNSDEVRTVSSIEELLNMENGYRYELTCDLDFAADETWQRRGFSGILDGKGYAIQNFLLFAGEGVVNCYEFKKDSGFFTYLDGIIENLNFESFVYTEDTVKGGFYATGVIGMATRSSIIRNCTLDENSEIVTTRTGFCVGGICGESQGLIENCTSYARISCYSYKSDLRTHSPSVGGICGESQGTIMNCNNYGSINAGDGYYVGGICGESSGILQKCTNHGDVYSFGYNLAGISGWGAYIEDCDNYGNVTAANQGDENYPFAITSRVNTEIKNCNNYGTISHTCDFDGVAVTDPNTAEGIYAYCGENGHNYGAIYVGGKLIIEAKQPPLE